MSAEHSLVDSAPVIENRPWNPLLALRYHRLGMMGFAFLVLISAFSLLYPLVDAGGGVMTDTARMYSAPSGEHWFGTDHLGRDLFDRVMAGGRLSLLVGLLAVVMAGFIGLFYGLLSGLGPRWLDQILMQILDTILSIPVILYVILIQAAGELSLLKITVSIALVSWMGVARIVRTESRRLMESDFIRASITSGCRTFAMVARHILPNLMGPLLVILTVSIGQAIILEATLSFINLGVPTTVPSWGNLLGNGLSAAMSGAWWTVFFPGMMIILTVLSINLVGDGLRDGIDPRNRSSD